MIGSRRGHLGIEALLIYDGQLGAAVQAHLLWQRCPAGSYRQKPEMEGATSNVDGLELVDLSTTTFSLDSCRSAFEWGRAAAQAERYERVETGPPAIKHQADISGPSLRRDGWKNALVM